MIWVLFFLLMLIGAAEIIVTQLKIEQVDKAFFISPIVDMEKLILDMMGWADITEEKLCACMEDSKSKGKKGLCITCKVTAYA